MANRVVLGSNIFRVTKPGFDALTETAPANLIFDMANQASLGSYSTGQINPLDAAWREYSFGDGTIFGVARIPFPNPGGYVPFALLQQYHLIGWTGPINEVDETTQRGEGNANYYNGSWQEGFYYYSTYARYSRLSYQQEKAALTAYTSVYDMMRYHVFYVKAADEVYAPQDVTPNAMSWNDVSVAAAGAQTNSVTVSGLEANVSISLKITSTLAGVAPGSYRVTAWVNRPSPAGLFQFNLGQGNNTFYIDVQNNDQVYFELNEPTNTGRQTTLTIENVTADPAYVIDTVTLAAQSYDRTPNALNWNDSGAVNYEYATNSQTFSGINTFIQIKAYFSTPFTGRFIGYGSGGNYQNISESPITYNAGNGAPWSWYLLPTSSYSGTVTIRNLSDGNAILDTFAVNITVPSNVVNVAWSDMNASTITTTNSVELNGFTDTARIANLTGSKNLTITLSNSGYYRFSVVKNGTPTNYTDGRLSFNVSVQNGDTLYFEAMISGTSGTWSSVATVSDGTRSSSFNIYLNIENAFF